MAERQRDANASRKHKRYSVARFPFERTAVNGFGFVQIIRRRERMNLMELLRADPVETAALALLRRAERHGNGGPATPPPPAVPVAVPLQQRVLEYSEAGMGVAEIARELGIGKGEVRLMLSLAKQKGA